MKLKSDEGDDNMRKNRNKNANFTLKNRFRYWFDNRMTKGSFGLIRVLIAFSILLAVFVAGLIVVLGFSEEGEEAATFWDSIATVINAWMPSFEDGSPGYLVLMSIVAIAGLLFTSVLIGIITSAIEEKIDTLKRGNSLVLEKDHIVVLGFYPGEYTLLHQLILAAAGKPCCVVVAEDMDREEMEQYIDENLDVPKNFRVVCRTVDITDPASLDKCSIETCKTVIVSPTEDMRTIKAVLAVSALLADQGVHGISVNAIISKNEYRFPIYLAEANNITTLQTNSILAKMIAHSCTQTGLSETFREVYNYEGCEFYLTALSGIEGLTFEELMLRTNDAVPVGVLRDGKVWMNPTATYVLHEDDRVLVFAEEADSAKLVPTTDIEIWENDELVIRDEEATDTVIIGHNETLPIILRELPLNVSHVHLAGMEITEEERAVFAQIAKERDLTLNYLEGDPKSERMLYEIAQMAEHIVILNNHEMDPEKADMEAIFLLLNLRDLRKRYKLSFNITVEMQKEHNQNLVGRGDHTDFLVASSMASLILAQLAESPELNSVFRELLSNEGSELYLKSVDLMGLVGRHDIRSLRHILLGTGYVLIGILDSNKNSRYNLPLNESVHLMEQDYLIVLSKE